MIDVESDRLANLDLEGAMDRIANRLETGGHACQGLPSGLVGLDNVTGGFHPGQLIVIGGRPSMGKTALALNITDHAATATGAAVLYFSLELDCAGVAERILCARSRIDGYMLRSGMGMGSREVCLLVRAYNEIDRAEGSILVVDTPGLDVRQVADLSREAADRPGVGLVVVDYLTLLTDGDTAGGQEERMASISRHLKNLARELLVPVLAVSQLTRGVERREDRRPRMSDLRGSGTLEEDADIILLIHRPDYYNANDQPGIAELFVAKNRNGCTDVVELRFHKNLTRFEDLAGIAGPPN